MNSQTDWFGWNNGELTELFETLNDNSDCWNDKGMSRDEIMNRLYEIHNKKINENNG